MDNASEMRPEFWLRPVFHVRDVQASVDYYCQCLGFTQAWLHSDEQPIIAQVGRHGLDIILDAASVIPRAAIPSVLSLALHDAEQLTALHQEMVDRGARIAAPPFEAVWQKGVYQFDVLDLDDNRLIFWGDGPA